MKKELLLTVLVLTVISLQLVIAQPNPGTLDANDTDTATVSVELASRTMVDVNPASLTWTGVNPGSEGDSDDEVGGFFAIQIENIGSHNITHIWFNATYPSSRPFATGTNESYNAGNFVVLSKENVGEYYFPNRVEYNESRSLVYLKDPGGNMPPSGYSYGRFRNTSYEYFWMTPNDDSDCVGDTFYIGTSPHTETQTGKTDFTSATNRCSKTLSASSESGWCYVDLSDADCGGDAGIFDQYTIYVKNQTFDQVIFYHWNKDTPDTTSNAAYFWDASGDPGIPLLPGNSTVADIRVWVPYGVYEGYVTQGTLTVVVNDV